MPLDQASLIKRIDDLLAVRLGAEGELDSFSSIVEALQGAVTIARLLYGATDATPQVQTMMQAAKRARELKQSISWSHYEVVWPVVQGSLRAMKADVEAGLVGNIERRAMGEVIADMLGLAKEALGSDGDGAKNVAAVLTAAAFEDTIRRMGASLANVEGRPDLQGVITALKQAQVLSGAPLSTAVGYLRFRNDALHADWARLDRAVVASCLAFVEGLVLRHLS